MTPEELDQRIAKAVIDLYRQKVPEPEETTIVEAIAHLANVPKGHVIQFFEARGIRGAIMGTPQVTEPHLQMIEAHVIMPLEASPAFLSQHLTVSNVHGSQVQMGHHISGSQSMVTYSYVLEQLKAEIERSAMPEADKKTALQRIQDLLDSPGVATLLKLAAKYLGVGT